MYAGKSRLSDYGMRQGQTCTIEPEGVNTGTCVAVCAAMHQPACRDMRNARPGAGAGCGERLGPPAYMGEKSKSDPGRGGASQLRPAITIANRVVAGLGTGKNQPMNVATLQAAISSHRQFLLYPFFFHLHALHVYPLYGLISLISSPCMTQCRHLWDVQYVLRGKLQRWRTHRWVGPFSPLFWLQPAKTLLLPHHCPASIFFLPTFQKDNARLCAPCDAVATNANRVLL